MCTYPPSSIVKTYTTNSFPFSVFPSSSSYPFILCYLIVQLAGFILFFFFCNMFFKFNFFLAYCQTAFILTMFSSLGQCFHCISKGPGPHRSLTPKIPIFLKAMFSPLIDLYLASLYTRYRKTVHVILEKRVFSSPTSPEHLLPQQFCSKPPDKICSKPYQCRGSALSARFKMFKDTKLSEISEGRGFYCFTDGKCQHAHFFFHPVIWFSPPPTPGK